VCARRYTEHPKQHAVAVHCGISAVPRRRDPHGCAPSLAARILRRRPLSKPRWKPKRQKQSTANDRRSLSFRTPGSKSDVGSGNFDAGGKRRRRWKLPGLALVTTSSGRSAYDASSMPQQQLLLKRTQISSLKPLQDENRQGEARYRVRIVDTRTYPHLPAPSC
jgi:hypothetical protein